MAETIATLAEIFFTRSNRWPGRGNRRHTPVWTAFSAIDRRQFRANVNMEPVSGRAFEEETWIDCMLRIGEEVLIGVTQRDTGCMMVNLDPESGTQNPRVLKTIVQGHQGQAGIYANVVRPGAIRVGDPNPAGLQTLGAAIILSESCIFTCSVAYND